MDKLTVSLIRGSFMRAKRLISCFVVLILMIFLAFYNNIVKIGGRDVSLKRSYIPLEQSDGLLR